MSSSNGLSPAADMLLKQFFKAGDDIIARAQPQVGYNARGPAVRRLRGSSAAAAAVLRACPEGNTWLKCRGSFASYQTLPSMHNPHEEVFQGRNGASPLGTNAGPVARAVPQLSTTLLKCTSAAAPTYYLSKHHIHAIRPLPSPALPTPTTGPTLPTPTIRPTSTPTTHNPSSPHPQPT